MTTVTDRPADLADVVAAPPVEDLGPTAAAAPTGPPPMRYPRLRMAIGIPAAAFPIVAPAALLTYQWSHHVISFARLTDVGILASVALGVAVLATVLAAVGLIVLGRKLARANEQLAALLAPTAAEPTVADVAAAAAYAAENRAIDETYASLGQRVEPNAYADLGRPRPTVPDELLGDSRPGGVSSAPTAPGSSTAALRAAAARASARSPLEHWTEPPETPKWVADRLAAAGLLPAVEERRGQHAVDTETRAIPAVPAVPPVVAPAAPDRRAPTPPSTLARSEPWPLPAPWSSPLAADVEQNGAAQ